MTIHTLTMTTIVSNIKKVLTSIITNKYFYYFFFILVLNVLIQKIFQYFLNDYIIHFFNISTNNISKFRIAEAIILSFIDYTLYHIYILNVKKHHKFINKLQFDVYLKLDNDFLSSKLQLTIELLFNNRYNAIVYNTKTEYFGNYIDFV